MIITKHYTANPGPDPVLSYLWSTSCASGITFDGPTNLQTVSILIDTDQVASSACTLSVAIQYADCTKNVDFTIEYDMEGVLQNTTLQIICGSTETVIIDIEPLCDGFTFQPGSIAVLSSAGEGVTASTDYTITYTPIAVPTIAVALITFTVEDTAGEVKNIGSIAILLMPCIEVPECLDDGPINVTCNLAKIINVLLNDPLVPTGSYVDIERHPAQGTVTVLSDNSILYNPNTDYDGVDGFEYIIVNPQGTQSLSCQVSIVVLPCLPCDPPTVSIALIEVKGANVEFTALTTSMLATDLFTITGNGNLLASPGDYTFNEPAQTIQGSFPVVGSGIQTLTIFISNACGEYTDIANIADLSGLAPVAVADNFTAIREISKVLNVMSNDYDPGGNAIIPAAIGGTGVVPGDVFNIPGQGDLVLQATGDILLIPAVGFVGIIGTTYQLRNFLGTLSNIVALTIDVMENCAYIVNIATIAANCTYQLFCLNPDDDTNDEVKIVPIAVNETAPRVRGKMRLTSSCDPDDDVVYEQTVYTRLEYQTVVALSINGYLESVKLYRSDLGTSFVIDISTTSPHLGGVPAASLLLPADFATNAAARTSMANAILQVINNALLAAGHANTSYNCIVGVDAGGNVATGFQIKHAPSSKWIGINRTDSQIFYNTDGATPNQNTTGVAAIAIKQQWTYQRALSCDTLIFQISPVADHVDMATSNYNLIVLSVTKLTIAAGGISNVGPVLCNDLELTANPVPVPVGPSYAWEFDAGSMGVYVSVGITQVIVVDGTIPGIYRCTVTASGCANTGYFTLV